MKRVLLKLAEWLAVAILLPFLAWSLLPLPPYTRFTAPSQILSIVPGFTGILLRRAWYKRTLARCGDNLVVDWLAVFRTPDTIVGDRCTIGVASWIGLASIGSDVMTGSHLIVTSGSGQHEFDDVSRPMRDQAGSKTRVEIGSDVWIGAGVIAMTHISNGTVVGAGSVITKTFAPYSIIAGNPAKILRARASTV